MNKYLNTENKANNCSHTIVNIDTEFKAATNEKLQLLLKSVFLTEKLLVHSKFYFQ